MSFSTAGGAKPFITTQRGVGILTKAERLLTQLVYLSGKYSPVVGAIRLCTLITLCRPVVVSDVVGGEFICRVLGVRRS